MQARLSVVFAAILSGPLLVAGPSGAQTLADALVTTYQTNPTLAIARAQLRQADERVAQAQANLLPDVNAIASTSLTDTQRTPDLARQSSTAFDARLGVTAEQTLFSGGRTPAQIASAKASVQSARARLVSVEQDVLLSAVQSFMDVRRDIQFVELARNNARVLSEQLRATQDRFEVGEVTRTDVSQAEAALAAARANLARNTGALSQSRTAFLTATGLEASRLAPPPPIPEVPRTRDEAEAIAIRSHPALTAARFNEEAATADVEIARAGLNPILTLSGSVFAILGDTDIGRDNSTRSSVAQVELQLVIPLYRGGELSSLIRQAMQVLEQRKAETQDTGRSIRQAVQVAWAGLQVARATIVANSEQIKAQEIAFAGVVEEAKFGERTTLDVLDAEQALLQARSDLVSAQRDAYVASYNLLSAMGLLTAEHLGLGVTPYDAVSNSDYVATNPAGPEGLAFERILDRWSK